MQNALDKAGDSDALRKEVEDKDSTIASLRQQLEETKDRLVSSVQFVMVASYCIGYSARAQ